MSAQNQAKDSRRHFSKDTHVANKDERGGTGRSPQLEDRSQNPGHSERPEDTEKPESARPAGGDKKWLTHRGQQGSRASETPQRARLRRTIPAAKTRSGPRARQTADTRHGATRAGLRAASAGRALTRHADKPAAPLREAQSVSHRGAADAPDRGTGWGRSVMELSGT